MTEIIEENNVIIFPPPAPNGTIIIQTTPMGQKRMMKMVNYDLQAKNYLDEVKANKTRTTFISFQAGLNRYGRYLAADGMKDSNCEYALSPTALNAYKSSLAETGILGQSIKGALCPIKSLCVYLIRMRLMTPEENPFTMLEMPGRQTPVRLLVSDDEVMQLMQAAERQNKPRTVAFSRLLVCTLVHTGARAQEAVDIQMDHINLDRETLEIRYGKGGKSRILNPPVEWWIALRAWLPHRAKLDCEHPYLFASGSRSHISDEMARSMLEDIKAIGGMKGRPNIKPHSLRHWFASHMHTNGATIPMIQAALGHSDPATTWRYIHNQANGTEPMKQLASFSPVGWGEAVDIERKTAQHPATAPVSPQPMPNRRSLETPDSPQPVSNRRRVDARWSQRQRVATCQRKLVQ